MSNEKILVRLQVIKIFKIEVDKLEDAESLSTDFIEEHGKLISSEIVHIQEI